jgi:hypothetical protein
MKTIIFLFVLMLAGTLLSGQVPQTFKYQAVARDGSGNALVNKNVSFRISIIQGTVTGAIVYSETHAATTNTYGLVNLEIGRGVIQTGSLVSINWAADQFFVKVEIDSGAGYVLMGTSQLLSVPYALYAKDVQNKNDADADPLNEIQTLSRTGNQVSLSKGGGSVAVDADTLNEIQALSIAGQSLSLNKGGGSVQLPTLAGGPFSSNGGITSNTPITDNFVFGSSSLNNLSGNADDSRFFFNKTKSAFRAGYAIDEWNDSNVGTYSTAFGFGTAASAYYSFAAGSQSKATGYGSVAIGNQLTVSGNYAASFGSQNDATGGSSIAIGSQNHASGSYSAAIGLQTTASGTNSTAMGSQTTASGDNSTAIGMQTNAKGNYSTALGYQTNAPSYREFVVGSSNTIYTPESATQWKPNDRLFVVGNGEGNGVTSDALVILKNGNMGIRTSTPTQTLDVNGSIKVRNLTNGAPANAVYATSDGTLVIGGMSDARLKENVLPLENSLEKVMKLQGVTFNWRADPYAGRKIGFIAQDFEKVIPELIFTNQNDGLKGINYAEVTAVLTEAIKELKAENDQFKARIEKLEGLIGAKVEK